LVFERLKRWQKWDNWKRMGAVETAVAGDFAIRIADSGHRSQRSRIGERSRACHAKRWACQRLATCQRGRVKTLLFLLLAGCTAFAGVCNGKDPCKVCTDCSDCWYCSKKNPKGGSCGVMRDQTGAQRAAADKKREKNGK